MPVSKGNILIVDDNKSILTSLDILLNPEFSFVKSLSNPGQILTELRKKEYNLVLLDMNFSAGMNNGNEGFYWLGRIKEFNPDISVVMITAYGDVDTAVRALKDGACDFVLKPWDNDKLLATLKLAIQLNLSKKEVKQLKDRESGLKNEINRDQREIIGSSQNILDVLKMARKVAKTNANVLITGENGTGKELIAREIHRLSDRSGELLVTVDMGAIPETLFESELFGHVKGAFTDARENRQGKFELADKGTLFLDEIGNLSFHMQSKLLAALQNREITRIGSNNIVPVDIRLICATNRNLDKMVKESLFREDLLYRINTIQIEIPPLRNRGNDIIELSDFFLKKFINKYGKTDLRVNNQAYDKLMRYSWPGNIRELQNTIEKAVILCDSSVIKPEDLYLKPPEENLAPEDILTLEAMEEKLINIAIEKNNGNLTAAAEQLGITRQTLYNKFRKNKTDVK
ncbi:MAG: sigma-54-dependent Fis family transcriptional regulator [Bacteroidetes bacterium]|nr:sigma-54-dependent Fis family transcriptional regulator [Bacteroidota bacterium]